MALRGDGAQVDQLEAAVDPHRGARGRGRQKLGEQRVEIVGHAHVQLDAGLEGGDDRERAAARGLGRVHRPVLGGAIDDPVGQHELAVERVERPQPEIATLRELGDGHIAVVGAVQQRLDRGDLKQLMRPAARVKLRGKLRVAHCLDVKRVEQLGVEHRA